MLPMQNEQKAVDDEHVEKPSAQDDDDSTGSLGFGLQRKWEEMFARLVAYKEKHGDCLVPNRYADDPQLGSWVSTQRRQYKILTSGGSESTPMTPERAARLVEVGFKWSTKDPRHVPWEERYKELCDFVKTYGHAQVPIGWEQNVQLSNWVSTQRQEYKLLQKGRSSRLTDDRIRQLNQVDFIWEAQRGGPRRKRKATVSVPAKANPIAGVGPPKRPSPSTRGGLAQGLPGGLSTGSARENLLATLRAQEAASSQIMGSQLMSLSQQQQHLLQSANALTQQAALLGQRAVTLSDPMLPSQVHPWQQMRYGGYQSPLGLQSSSIFPLARPGGGAGIPNIGGLHQNQFGAGNLSGNLGPQGMPLGAGMTAVEAELALSRHFAGTGGQPAGVADPSMLPHVNFPAGGGFYQGQQMSGAAMHPQGGGGGQVGPQEEEEEDEE